MYSRTLDATEYVRFLQNWQGLAVGLNMLLKCSFAFNEKPHTTEPD